jgi:hypothetical protein
MHIPFMQPQFYLYAAAAAAAVTDESAKLNQPGRALSTRWP